MANYGVDDHIFTGTPAAVAAAIETKLETIDTAKTIRHLSVHVLRVDQAVGVLIIDA